ncbi:putative protease Do-like 14 [Eucalyptus grandis]|uniref:putative protease Do-like 14 n=1 Tax=Eucalyptus grandis TaxID=71139 RepID=UPI00192EAFAD|nr:putative protease Do-like 14 [Eucalyptus grandis]
MARIAVAGTWLFHGYASSKYLGLLHADASKYFPKSLQTSLIRCYDTNKAASAKSEENATPNKGYFRSIIAEAAAGITPAVVHLYAQQGQDEKFGSGAVIHEDGYILTCSHIFFDKTNMIHSSNGKVLVRLQKPKEDVVGQESKKDVVGQVVDAYVDLDIAIIKIDPPSSSLSTAKVGSSSKLHPGDWAIAMGSPLCLPNTITLGIFSHVCRTSKDISDGGMHVEYLQTDCAINPGNSGGPLCNLDGELVGVNVETMKPDKAFGLSFAVPVDFISTILKPFQSCHYYNGLVKVFCSIQSRNFPSTNYDISSILSSPRQQMVTCCRMPVQAYFGWVMWNVSEENYKTLKQRYPTFPKAEEGVFVQKVIKGYPAYRAGVQDGDVIVDFNGKKAKILIQKLFTWHIEQIISGTLELFIKGLKKCVTQSIHWNELLSNLVYP